MCGPQIFLSSKYSSQSRAFGAPFTREVKRAYSNRKRILKSLRDSCSPFGVALRKSGDDTRRLFAAVSSSRKIFEQKFADDCLRNPKCF